MPFRNNNLNGHALFDVKPVDETGSVDVGKISAVKAVVNLTAFKRKLKHQIPNPKSQIIDAETQSKILNTKQSGKIPKLAVPFEEVLPPVMELPTQQSIKKEFEELMNHDLDLGVELAQFGGQALRQAQGRPRYKVIQPKVQAKSEWKIDPVVAMIQRSAMAISKEEYEPTKQIEDTEPIAEPTLAATSLEMHPEVENDVRLFYSSVPTTQLVSRSYPRSRRNKSLKIPHVPLRFIIYAAAALVVLGLLVRYGFHLKHQIVEQSSAAVNNLQTAQTDLKALDFKNASEDFFSAYADFSKAGDQLNVFGAVITDIISALPGGGSLKSAKNLVQVGQELSAAGTSMTAALDSVSRTGALSDLANLNVPVGPIASVLKKALISSQQKVAEASSLMADIDGSIIPQDKQAAFLDFKSKLPELETAINMSADYAKFFENLVLSRGQQKYLVMFQNASELRPTGGFPGTYGVISFTDGKMNSLNVDDVYNIDGQLQEHIIPPKELQHITPNWGLRDSNWYVDFPTSARNMMSFYRKESSQSVDGVIVINPEMIPKILDIVGPIKMPQYNLTLTSQNVLTAIQGEVEYGANRTQPKQVVKDFAPLLLSKIYSAGSDRWLSIFNTLVLSMNQHDVLMYFNNLSLESFVIDKGFGGQVHQGDSDYMMATITNIKGSKTDAVTDTSMDLKTTFDGSTAVHSLTITRQHNGGQSKFGFYNKQNPAYVRVLVPEGTELISIDGNDRPNFAPLINYAQDKSFVSDDDLVKLESSGSKLDNGVTTYSEANKKEFGFWLITDAGKSKTVTIQYRVPEVLKNSTYELYIQKQPALKIKKFNFSLQSPPGLTPTASAPLLTQSGNTYTYSNPLNGDLSLKVNF